MTNIYSRTYYGEKIDGIAVPDGYDGTALTEGKAQGEPVSIPHTEPPKREVKISPSTVPEENEGQTEQASADEHAPFSLGGLFSRFGLSSFRTLLPNNLFHSFENFGLEEILIIGIAAFLLFSKSSDRELALMLLFLIFVK